MTFAIIMNLLGYRLVFLNISYGFAWNTTSGLVSMLHLIERLGFVLCYDNVRSTSSHRDSSLWARINSSLFFVASLTLHHWAISPSRPPIFSKFHQCHLLLSYKSTYFDGFHAKYRYSITTSQESYKNGWLKLNLPTVSYPCLMRSLPSRVERGDARCFSCLSHMW